MATQNIYALTDTWNAGGTTFTAIKMDVLDTASAAGSLLIDLQTGGTSRFSVTKAGVLTVGSTIELGNASDTTLARASAGVVTIEGNTVYTSGNLPGSAITWTATPIFNTDMRFQIGATRLVRQLASVNHDAGNVGSLTFGISDGGGNCGVKVSNTHDGTYSSQEIEFITAQGGFSAATTRMKISKDGSVVVGSPTGGEKGTGTINAQAVYDDNVLLTCYVIDAALDGQINMEKWDAKVPNRVVPAKNAVVVDFDAEPDAEGNRPTKVVELEPEGVEERIHEGARKFAARLGGEHDPLDIDKYAAHWKSKRHLSSMPNEEKFDPVLNMPTGSWIQRLIETAEIQAVHIENLNQRLKALESKATA